MRELPQGRKRGRPAGNHRLIVSGELQEKPDWDAFIADILAEGFRRAGLKTSATEILAATRAAEVRESRKKPSQKQRRRIAEVRRTKEQLDAQWQALRLEQELRSPKGQQILKAYRLRGQLIQVLRETQKQKAKEEVPNS